VTDNDDGLLESMGESQKAVAALTGMKQQFINAGWSEPVAEQMVVEIFRKSSS
jgi:hypothetical protein